MTTSTKSKIALSTRQLFSTIGYEGFSIRLLSSKSGIGASSIYHFFTDKDELLRFVFTETNIELGIQRAALPKRKTANKMLWDRIVFQFDHIEEVVYVLKFYLHFRDEFQKNNLGYVPPKAYLHIEEVLKFGVNSGEFYIKNNEIEKQAKVVTHAINGFLLEYFPEKVPKKELYAVVEPIHELLIKGLTNKEWSMK